MYLIYQADCDKGVFNRLKSTAHSMINQVCFSIWDIQTKSASANAKRKQAGQKHKAHHLLSLLLLLGELHTSVASQLPPALLPLWDWMWLLLQCWSHGSCKVHMLFPFAVSAGVLAPLGNSYPCVLLLSSFLYSGRNCTGELPLHLVASLLYSNIFPTLERPQIFVSCPWVRTRAYRLKH